MLNNYSVDAVSVLAQSLADRGIVLSAVNGTLLSEANGALSSISSGPENSLLIDGEAPLEVAVEADAYSLGRQLIAQSVKVTLEEQQSDHTLVVDRGAILIADSIAGSMANARNTVRPFVDNICSQVENILNGQILTEAGCLSIVPDTLPEIWDNPSFVSLYKRFETTPYDNVKLERIHPPMDYDEIAARLRTGSPAVDKLVDDLVATTGRHLIEDVYTHVFVNRDASVAELLSRERAPIFAYPYGDITDYLVTTDEGDRNIVLIIFLLANRLVEDIPEGIRMAIDTYQNYMTQIMAQAGRALNVIEKLQADRQAANRLVKSWPGVTADKVTPINGMIRVDEKLYKAWLEKGGSPEILFGVFVTGDFGRSVIEFDALLVEEVATRYRSEWNNFYAMRETLATSQRQNNVHAALSKVLHAFVRDTEESPFIREDKSVLHDRIFNRMKVIRPEHYQDEDLLVLYVVCDVFFAESDAKFILLSMAASEKANPGIKPREASLDAMLELMADWIVDNFIVTGTGVANGA